MKTNNLTISNESKLTIFGGVNVIESDDLLFEVADKFVELSEKYSFNYVFKSSFDRFLTRNMNAWDFQIKVFAGKVFPKSIFVTEFVFYFPRVDLSCFSFAF